MREHFSPVVVFGYNRPSHIRQALQALSEAQGAAYTELWIFCDGAKPNQESSRIEEVRAVAADECWKHRFASVDTVFASGNKGLARSVIEGVSRVLARSDRVIVLEDDLIVAPDYLLFMNDCLDFYAASTEVGTVTGFTPLQSRPSGYSEDVYAVPRNCSYGWGTWRDRWSEIDWSPHAIQRIWSDAKARMAFTSAGPDQIYRLWRQSRGEIDSWSVRVDTWLALTGRVTIYPAHNRIANIGYDGSGVHCAVGDAINNEISATLTPYALTHVRQSARINREFRRIYGGSLARRVLRKFRDWAITSRTR